MKAIRAFFWKGDSGRHLKGSVPVYRGP